MNKRHYSWTKKMKYASILAILPSLIVLTSHYVESGECDTAKTTYDMSACLEARLRTSNDELTTLQARIEHQLSQEKKEALVKAQTAWLSYRTANCASQAILYRGGSMEPLVAVGCKIRSNEQRTQELMLIYEEILRVPNQ